MTCKVPNLLDINHRLDNGMAFSPYSVLARNRFRFLENDGCTVEFPNGIIGAVRIPLHTRRNLPEDIMQAVEEEAVILKPLDQDSFHIVTESYIIVLCIGQSIPSHIRTSSPPGYEERHCRILVQLAECCEQPGLHVGTDSAAFLTDIIDRNSFLPGMNNAPLELNSYREVSMLKGICHTYVKLFIVEAFHVHMECHAIDIPDSTQIQTITT
ncbi:hypothetical protein SODALDRAFT_354841 [Sodiomyces alkalinus F11]|uniref:Uncharacterized protein n=1 Tax=Sodiomyces alkalinus (strain CBS 110278 / VKM F-3762 / F11) TaxID=1314773 RepID=A0A3N2Q7M3_SODAK|nr:hypothetical protein SODALDRAFT_354841 [Sodiomyces alkalinus F11]ROT42677.1 hypothetical protein SODALDRAFT_354841 [Sodiomyces alkalinus F11]